MTQPSTAAGRALAMTDHDNRHPVEGSTGHASTPHHHLGLALIEGADDAK